MSKYLDEYVLGEHFVSAARTVTECDVVNFACMTGDMHPNHTDAEVMKHSQFGQRIAHGLLGISWAHGFLDRLDLITDSFWKLRNGNSRRLFSSETRFTRKLR